MNSDLSPTDLIIKEEFNIRDPRAWALSFGDSLDGFQIQIKSNYSSPLHFTTGVLAIGIAAVFSPSLHGP